VNIKTALAAARGRAVTLISAAALIIALTPTFALANPSVRLMVDPGHGGTDPGAIGNGVVEKDTNFQISQKVVKAAQRQGWHVGMTRSRDRFIPLTSRSAFANKWEATAFVSIHSNSYGPRAQGNMTIHRGGRSGILSQSIMNRIQRLTPYNDIGSRRDVRGLAVLKTSKAPAVIVEVLSVSSAPEAKTLKDPVMQNKYAEAIVMGVADFHGLQYKAPMPPKAAPKPTPAPKPAPTPKAVPAPAPQAAPEPTPEAPEAADPKVESTPEPTADPKVEGQAPAQDRTAPEASLKAALHESTEPAPETAAAQSAADRSLEPIATWLDGLIERLVGKTS
jgi:N-acetylmuramoyl-L-alanine amidase